MVFGVLFLSSGDNLYSLASQDKHALLKSISIAFTPDEVDSISTLSVLMSLCKICLD